MTSKRFVLVMTMFIACGKREHIATSAFASDGAIHGTAITRASGGCAHSGTPSMLKVTCTGPRLAPGHYVVKEDGFADVAHLALEATVGPDGTGELRRVPVEP